MKTAWRLSVKLRSIAWDVTVPSMMRLWLRCSKGTGQAKVLDDVRGFDHTALHLLDGQSVVWAHGASIGEVKCLSPIIEALLQEGCCQAVLFSYTSPDGLGEICAISQNLPQRILSCPLHCTKVRTLLTMLSQSNLRLCIIAESDTWPPITWVARELHAPTLVVDARFRPASSSFRTRIKSLFYRRLARHFTMVCAGTEEDHRSVSRSWGPRSLLLTGPGKAIASLRSAYKKPILQAEYRQLLQLGDGQVLVMGSLVPNEAELGSEIAAAFLRSYPKSFVIMAPRHTRKPEVMRCFEEALRAKQLPYSFFSSYVERKGPSPALSTRIVLVDRMNYLQDLYSVANVAVVGGSFVDSGGHNFLEPIAMKVPVICGPTASKWQGICKRFIDTGAILQVRAEKLGEEIDKVLSGPQYARAKCELAHSILREMAVYAEENIRVARALASGEGETLL
jgi:3-deoxy-D-manno-octulosonic-acid transferase